MATNQIVTDLIEIARNGSEESAKIFIRDNWNQIPDEVRDELAVALMTDAVREHLEKNVEEKSGEQK